LSSSPPSQLTVGKRLSVGRHRTCGNVSALARSGPRCARNLGPGRPKSIRRQACNLPQGQDEETGETQLPSGDVCGNGTDKQQQGDKKPVRFVPRPKPTITPQDFNELVQLVSEPYATMLYVAVWTGLRVSEVIGLKWRCIHADSMTVEERYCRGDWSVPKTDASAATIGVEPHVIARILHLKTLTAGVRAGSGMRTYKLVKSDSPDALVFQSVKDGRPMNDQNILKRHIQPAARKLGLPFVNWRCLRTSHATWLVQAGADPKSVQGQMRHTRISTTMDIYAQIIPAAQRRALQLLSEFAKCGPVDSRSITVQ